ncbi:hypothetical protein BMF94_6903 [Rhodotorula taiwanensis]|uniref:Plus3 domain-containing protein n=1 Tax=Rhodotorula taiwanensis TaxID=741276 RepID=A0A2S5B028_9BASI|nr:hypothetical protein BMF94_6903 [Rhodotorula taiwanensis]
MDMSASDSDAPAASGSRSKGGRVKSAAQVDDSDDSDAEGEPTEDNPYPVEGLYRDDAERERVARMPELEREEFMANREEQIRSARERADVAQMVARSADAAAQGNKKKKIGKAAAAGSDDDDDGDYGSGEASRSTRSRKTTGSSKTKAEGIEKLKQSRAAKGKKKQKASDSDDDYEEGTKKSSRRRAASDSGSDMETSSDDDRAKKPRGSTKSGPPVASFEELRGCQITRSRLANMCRAPFFDEWITNPVRDAGKDGIPSADTSHALSSYCGVDAWVRYPQPDVPGGPPDRPYRFYQVAGVRHKEPYKVEGMSTDVILDLRYGRAITPFRMDAVSNTPVTIDEYGRMRRTFEHDKAAMPTPVQAKKLKDELDKHQTYLMTEEDISAQLAAKGHRPSGAAARARLVMELQDAKRVGDMSKAADVQARLAELEGPAGSPKDEADRAKRINDRNRAANREEIKRAEAKSQEERRKQAEALQRGDTNVKIDKSARVKTMPRHTYDSRPATPGNSGASTPIPPAAAAVAAAADAGANGAPKAKASKIEAVVASRVQLNVDLDF